MVVILLSTYNGAAYLPEWLHSLKQQSYTQWKLLVRDDGSCDESIAMIETFFYDDEEHLEVIPSHENIGVKASFNRLVDAALQMPLCEYVMFADQDDIWKPDKIAQTLAVMQRLQHQYASVPLLVHTDLHVSDEQMNIIDTSLWHYEHNDPYKDTLNYLLYQNTATGCSMMVNRTLLERAFPVPEAAIMHDWWCSLVAAAFGKRGIVTSATLYYRQHANNTIGAKEHDSYALFQKISNLILMKNEPYLRHLEPNRAQAQAFLQHYHDSLNSEQRALLHFFCTMAEYSWFQKRWNILRFRCLRQGWIQNIGLLLRV